MQELRSGNKGAEVRAHQENLNARLRAHRDTPIEIDGEVGPVTLEQTAYAAWFLGAMDGTVEKVRDGLITVGVQEMIADPETRTPEQRERARARRSSAVGRTIHSTVCSAAGSFGPGGSPRIPTNLKGTVPFR